MRTIQIKDITEAVADMCMKAGAELPSDVYARLQQAKEKETSPTAREILRQLLENADLAKKTRLPLCQDCGIAVLFVEVGDDVRIEGGNIREAVNAGVRKGYAEGYLRKSVCDPFTRANTGDNTPAVIHFDAVPGDKLRIVFLAKGGGCENMSRVTMLAPAQGWEGVKRFVINRVADAGANPCPPTIVGVGVGGAFDRAAELAEKALTRRLDDIHPNPDIAAKEKELETALNKLGVGPMGLGGETTVLGVKIAAEPCHLACLPLAVNIQCHSHRRKEVVL